MLGACIISERRGEMSYELFGDFASLVAAASLRWPLNNRKKNFKAPLVARLLFICGTYGVRALLRDWGQGCLTCHNRDFPYRSFVALSLPSWRFAALHSNP